MSRRAAVAVGVRLATGATRADRVRLGLMALGVALGVSFVLGALGAAPAAAARGERLAARAVGHDDVTNGGGAPAGVVVLPREDVFHGRRITSYAVATVGATTAVPPGLDALPRPGELAVSPAFAALLRAPGSAALRERYPERVVATVRPDGLLGPEELLVWVGTPRDRLHPGLSVAAAFGAPVPAEPRMSDEHRIAVALGVVGLLVPVLVLVATATRLNAAARDRRLAALRLVGATPEQARLVAATEAGLVAAAGALPGVALLAVLREVVAPRVPVLGGVWPADVAPSPLAVAAVLLATPLLAVAVGLLSLRRVVTSPLGVARQAVPRRARAVRLVPLAAGLALLIGAYLDRKALLAGGDRGAVLIVGGAGLTIIGLAVAAPFLAAAAAAAVARAGAPPALHLGARRVQADPGAAARVVTGSALLVFVGGWLFAFLPLLEHANTGFRSAAPHLRAGSVVVQAGDVSRVVAAVRGVEGVAAVVTVRTVLVAPRGEPGRAVPVAVADCAALGAALARPLAGCAPGVGYGDVPGEGVLVRHGDDGTPREVGAVTRPAAFAADRALADLNVVGIGGAVLPPESVPPGPPEVALVATDGSAAAVERVRTAAARTGAWYARTLTELVAAEAASVRTYRAMTVFALVAAGVLAAGSLAVTSVDAVAERRRSLAALVACGTPVGVLRRAVLAQTALSLLPAVAVAGGCSAFASALYLAMGGERVDLPWGAFAALAGGAVAAVAVATLATLPAVGGAARPEGLRST